VGQPLISSPIHRKIFFSFSSQPKAAGKCLPPLPATAATATTTAAAATTPGSGAGSVANGMHAHAQRAQQEQLVRLEKYVEGRFESIDSQLGEIKAMMAKLVGDCKDKDKHN
jgi:hypothetical protein